MTEPFDKEAVYDSEIAPLMSQIIKVCQENEIPFVASFVYRRDEDGDEDHCISAIPHDSDTTKRAVDVITGKAMTVPKASALVMTITHGDR